MREGGPARPARGSGGALYAPPAGFGAEPQKPTLFYYIRLKTLHKTACKTEIVYSFHESNNSADA